MRKTLYLALVASLVLALTVPAVAFAQKGPKGELASGTGQIESDTLSQQIHVNAKQNSAKGTVKGQITEKTTDGADTIRYKAKVTCLNVVDQDAVIGGQIVKAQAGVPEEAQGVLVFLHDGGSPGAGQDEVSREFTTTVPDDAACQEAVAGGLTPITKGNYTVKDVATTS